MPYSWTKWGKEASLLFRKMCSKCVMPLSDHERRWRGFLLLRKSGLFQMGVSLHGDRVEFVILWNSHQAVRADDTVIVLKQG